MKLLQESFSKCIYCQAQQQLQLQLCCIELSLALIWFYPAPQATPALSQYPALIIFSIII